MSGITLHPDSSPINHRELGEEGIFFMFPLHTIIPHAKIHSNLLKTLPRGETWTKSFIIIGKHSYVYLQSKCYALKWTARRGILAFYRKELAPTKGILVAVSDWFKSE